ncbi:DUF2252 domain-containing protein [Acetobacter persici]|uniref:DUF2252 domain-containing protein n=1 Tax=Acetobacter persici TaxID=1076596 RepID=UPI001F2B2282|nr:DUF2252 domain-containing protein [Acetobacter persici]MCG0997349.1 DUF2252 domain-containing protein [Acetobacter persici]
MTSAPPALTASLRPRALRHAEGVKLRKRTPRTQQAEWQSPKNRQDPVSILVEQGMHRISALLPVRYARMAASPFAFLRGAAAVMAADLAGTPAAGPTVQSCGDCHLANFGSYASPEGVPVFDINDFDETLSAPFEWDVKRLGTSLVLAGREGGLSDGAASTLARSMAQAYAQEMAYLAPLNPLAIWAERIDLAAAIAGFQDKQARKKVQSLLDARLESARSHFGLVADNGGAPRLTEKPPLVMRLPEQDDTIRAAFARYLATQPPERAILLSRYTLQDVIFKVVGVGSVGTFCAIGLFATPDNEVLLLQIKEAQTSVLAPHLAPSPFHNQGERVVTGQRIMQTASDAFLGWTHSGGTDEVDGETGTQPTGQRQFYVRRLKDQRLAAIGAEFAQIGLPDYALLCGRTLARAHARSGDVATLSGYLGAGRAFADAIASFSTAYADQTKADWKTFCAAIKAGRIFAQEPGTAKKAPAASKKKS